MGSIALVSSKKAKRVHLARLACVQLLLVFVYYVFLFKIELKEIENTSYLV